MAIFDRIADILKANINDMIDKAEDPEKMVKQLIIEMEEQVDEATRALGQAMGSQKVAAKELADAMAEAADWEDKAKLALKARNEVLAKKALDAKVGIDEQVKGLQASYDQMTAQVNKPSEEDYQKALQGEFWPERLNNTYIDNYRAPSYKDLELNAVSIGDVAFVTLPTEFCDTLGEAIKDGSPFATTVLLGYTCSKGRYMQDLASVPNGGYEVYYSWFVPGTGEAAVEHYLDTLGAFYPVRAGK